MTDLFCDHVPLLRPWIGEEEIEAVADVLRSGWISQGPRVQAFEEAVAEYVGVLDAVATNACTTALHLALLCSGVGPGDEVVMPSFTCMATANAVHHAGALPVFADIEPGTYNLDPAAAEAAITPRTKAILVVHQIGLPANLDAFNELGQRRGLVVIEDAATALGATYKSQPLGGSGRPVCFSFHPRKMITTGEGGMITTNDRGLADLARQLRATGASISDLERHKAKGLLVQKYAKVGFNYRLTDIQAAIGLVQMGRLDRMLAERATQARRYRDAFGEIDGLAPPLVPAGSTHAYSSYCLALEPARIGQRAFLEGMARRGISCRTGIQPLHREPYYEEAYRGRTFPESERAAGTTVFLPIFPGLSELEQERVINSVRDVLAEA